MAGSLSNMASSVDWSKVFSKADARNAAIGSALGGLMLGGASLAQDKDPDEEKSAPVKDALLGALLGGTAAYGIPKGLSLFRDSGSLAPDDDRINTSWVDAAKSGARFGAGTASVFTIPPLYRAFVRETHRKGSTLKGSLHGMFREMARGKRVGGNIVYNDGPLHVNVEGKPFKNILGWLRNRMHGSHYEAKVIKFPFKKFYVSPKMRIAGRVGKYAAIFGALSALSHGIFGGSSKDNFKN